MLKREVYNNVLQTLEDLRKLYIYYKLPESGDFEDIINYVWLLKNVIYAPHKNYGTTLVEYVQSLNKIVSPRITHAFVDDFFQDLNNICYVDEDKKKFCNKQ